MLCNQRTHARVLNVRETECNNSYNNSGKGKPSALSMAQMCAQHRLTMLSGIQNALGVDQVQYIRDTSLREMGDLGE